MKTITHYNPLFIAAMTLGASSAFAAPVEKIIPLDQFPVEYSTAVHSGVDYNGILKLSNCSGALIRFETSLDTDAAMVLTNGHCRSEGMPGPGEVFVNQPSDRSFGLLAKDGNNLVGKILATRILYSTMTGTDVTLYETRLTYREIDQRFGIQPLVLSSQHPSEGTRIAVVSGYWRKIYTCSIAKFIYVLKEGDWTMSDSIKYTQPGCEVIHGTSGSPIINADNREVIGINNTGNDDGQRCTENNPCEVSADGKVIVEKGASYGQETYRFYSCLDAKRGLDLNKVGCLLAKPDPSKPTPAPSKTHREINWSTALAHLGRVS